MRNVGRAERRPARHDHEVQSDGEARVLPRQGHGVVARIPGHHEAGARQDAAAMRLDDRAIDAARKPEVVARDDEASQARSSRFQRKLANSAPSRSRRLSMAGLATISTVISSIFLGRK